MERDLVVVIVRNPAGDFFVHRRRDDKEIYPGKCGLGAGGRVEAGEAPESAARRELFEETGLRAPTRFLFRETYREPALTHHLHVFETTVEPAPIPNDDSEWHWSGWLSPRNVDALHRAGELCPDTALVYERYRGA